MNCKKSLFMACWAAMAATAQAQITIDIDAQQRGPKVSPMLYGIFYEDINHAADGGIYAELIRNRSFEDGPRFGAPADMQGWATVAAEPSVLAARLIQDSKKTPLLNNAQVVVADGNLSGDALLYLAGHCTVPVFADPVSVTKAEKLRPILSSVHTLKPNRLEAEKLSGVPVTDEGSARKAAEKLLETGMRRVFISLGKEGVLAADHQGCLLQPSLPAKVCNTTGAGDAFMAALVWAYLEGMDLAESTKAASAAAAIAAEGKETINPALSEAEVRARIQEEVL